MDDCFEIPEEGQITKRTLSDAKISNSSLLSTDKGNIKNQDKAKFMKLLEIEFTNR